MKVSVFTLFAVMAQLMVSQVSSAADRPISSGAFEEMSAWCSDTRTLLGRARQDAEYSLMRGDYAGAELVLRQGLADADAAGRHFRGNGPLTARAVYRGIQLSDAIAALTAQAPQGARTRTYFLFKYYDFVVETVDQLDLPYYLPYRHCGMCGRINATVFEQRFVQYAKSQLSLVLETLAERGGYGRGRVFPVGSTPAFLKALEISAANAAGDLRESLWSARYACASGDLMRISRELAHFNSGAASSYVDEVDAMQRSYWETEDVLHLMFHTDCGVYPRR